MQQQQERDKQRTHPQKLGFDNATEFGNALDKILEELPVTSDRDTLPAGT